jgi:hypothetical protein
VRRNFPRVDFGFAYGSGVFAQPELYAPGTPRSTGPMLDFIFVVDSPLKWHEQVWVNDERCGSVRVSLRLQRRLRASRPI